MDADLGKAIFTGWHDPDLRGKLTADPHAALEGVGMTIPAGMTIRFVEDNATHVHLVIDRPSAASICLGSAWIRLVHK